MAFFDVEAQEKKIQNNNAKILGGVIMIAGITLVTWFIADIIYVTVGLRVSLYNDTVSISRLVFGVISILGGMIVMKNEDWSTITA